LTQVINKFPEIFGKMETHNRTINYILMMTKLLSGWQTWQWKHLS